MLCPSVGEGVRFAKTPNPGRGVMSRRCSGLACTPTKPAETRTDTVVVVNAHSDPSQPVQGVRVSLIFVAGSEKVTDARDATNRAGQALLIVSPEAAQRGDLRIEIDLLHEPVGKQDQYIASFGGITCFQFLPDDRVDVAPLQLESETMANLEDNLLLFFTGFTRSASAILEEQDTRTRQHDADMISQLHVVKQLGCESKTALERGDLRRFAELMHVHWEHKKARSRSMTNAHIDEYYELARRNGALGGKLIGAGGGGFLMLYTEDKTRLRHAMRGAGLREVRMRFDFQGTTVLAQS